MYSSALLLGSAFLSALFFLVYSFTKLRFADPRYSVVIGLAMLIGYHLVTFPWPFYGPISTCKVKNETTTMSTAMFDTTTLYDTTMSSTVDYSNYSTTAIDPTICHLGCNDEYTWCESTKKLPIYMLIIAYASFFALGMVQTAAPVGVLYSRVIGPRRQGTMQGIFAQVNSLARTVAPIVMLQLFQIWGPMVAWAVEAAVVTVALIIVLIFYKRLVPLKTVAQLSAGQSTKYKRGVLSKF